MGPQPGMPATHPDNYCTDLVLMREPVFTLIKMKNHRICVNYYGQCFCGPKKVKGWSFCCWLLSKLGDCGRICCISTVSWRGHSCGETADSGCRFNVLCFLLPKRSIGYQYIIVLRPHALLLCWKVIWWLFVFNLVDFFLLVLPVSIAVLVITLLLRRTVFSYHRSLGLLWVWSEGGHGIFN